MKDGEDHQEFEKAWKLVSRDGIVNVLSAKSFVLALNNVQMKWMMPQKPSSPLFKSDKKYSSIEQRLLGIERA